MVTVAFAKSVSYSVGFTMGKNWLGEICFSNSYTAAADSNPERKFYLFIDLNPQKQSKVENDTCRMGKRMDVALNFNTIVRFSESIW